MAKLTSELLRPVDAASALDEAALLRYATAHVPGFPSPAPALVLTQFGHGQSNPTYCLEASAPGGEARRYVLRKKPPGAILQSAHAVEREFQAARPGGAGGPPGAGEEAARVGRRTQGRRRRQPQGRGGA